MPYNRDPEALRYAKERLAKLSEEAAATDWPQLGERMYLARANSDVEAGHSEADDLLLICLLKSSSNFQSLVWLYLTMHRFYA